MENTKILIFLNFPTGVIFYNFKNLKTSRVNQNSCTTTTFSRSTYEQIYQTMYVQRVLHPVPIF